MIPIALLEKFYFSRSPFKLVSSRFNAYFLLFSVSFHSATEAGARVQFLLTPLTRLDLCNSNKGPIATFYCDVPTEKVIFKGEQMHVRI